MEKISVLLPLAKTRRERPLVGSEQCNSPDSRHREKTLYVCSLPSHRGQLPAMADFGPGGSRRFNCILALTVPVARGFYPIPFTPPPDLKTRSLQQTATPDKRTLFTFYLLIVLYVSHMRNIKHQGASQNICSVQAIQNPMITRIIFIDSLCQVVNKILIFYLLQVSASRPTLFDL